jgi:DNA modification methylase
MDITQHHGDCLAILPTLEPQSVQCIVTSPPYWRMRQYTDDPAEIGQEPTPAAYVAALVAVFDAARRVLRDDGTLFLNLGDAYADDRKWGGSTGGKAAQGLHGQAGPGRAKVTTGLPPKSLIGLPWRVAFGLQDAGWVLRAEIIWHKPNAMPESVTDRPTRDHETLFLFAKQARYYYDAAAIAEPLTESRPIQAWAERKAAGEPMRRGDPRTSGHITRTATLSSNADTRNARTVWSIATTPLADAHYAPMPLALAERCIKAGSRPGDTVLDMFGGSGTTGRAAIALQRHAVLIDLGYQELQARRTDGVQVRMTALVD